jgi:hypothetical protein
MEYILYVGSMFGTKIFFKKTRVENRLHSEREKTLNTKILLFMLGWK